MYNAQHTRHNLMLYNLICNLLRYTDYNFKDALYRKIYKIKLTAIYNDNIQQTTNNVQYTVYKAIQIVQCNVQPITIS